MTIRKTVTTADDLDTTCERKSWDGESDTVKVITLRWDGYVGRSYVSIKDSMSGQLADRS